MRRSRTEMLAASASMMSASGPDPASRPAAATPGQARLGRAAEAEAQYRAGRYEAAADLYRAALTEAACNDPAVVVLESTALAAAKGGGGGFGGGFGGGNGGGGLGTEPLDLDLLLDMINRAATAHNLGLAQSAAAAAASSATNGPPNAPHWDSAGARGEDKDPLPSHRRSAALYKLCHALVSDGRVRNARMSERGDALVAPPPSFLGGDDGNAAASRRLLVAPICAELSAAQSLLAAAEALAQRSDVDGTIQCHEEVVSFLLGVDEGDGDANGHGDANGDADQNSLLDNGTADDGDVVGQSNAGESGPDTAARSEHDEDDAPAPAMLSPSSASSTTAGGDDAAAAAAAAVQDAAPPTNLSASAAPLFVTMNEHQRMRLISNSLNALGNLYSRRGDDEDAIVSFTDALDLLRSIENPVGVVDDPTAAQTGGDIQSSGGMDGNGNGNGSSKAGTEIDIRDDIARTLLSLSTLHGRRGELDDAIDYGEEALDVLAERHGDTDAKEKGKDNEGSNRHPAVLSVLHALGRLYDLDGDFDAAMSCYEDAFLGRCKNVGSDDICVADVLVDMSSALQRNGNNVDGALELNSQALRIYRLLLSNESNERVAEGVRQGTHQQQRKCKICLAGTLQNRGSMYMEKNDHDEALNCYADAMENLRNIKGEEHPDVATLWAVMGDANVVGERFDAAKDCYAAALEAHRMRGLEDTDSPILWMLQKIRVIEDIVASAHKEDDEFIEDLATRAEDTSDQMKGAAAAAIERADKDFLDDLATNAESEPEESSQQRAKRLLAQKQEDDQFMREIDAVTPQNNGPAIPNENENISSFIQEEQAFLAELASGTLSDDDNNKPDTRNVAKPMSPTKPMPIIEKDPSFTKKTRPQMRPPQSIEPMDEIESVAGPAGIKEIFPQASADDTVSLITFKEEAMLSNVGNGWRGSYQRQNVHRTRSSSGGKPQKADWLTNTLGNIVEQADNFLRPLAEHPQQSQLSSGKTKGQAPVSEITFTIGGDGQEIARTRSADSDITDIMDVHGTSPTSGEPRVPGQAVEEEIGEEIGIEVDELLAKMASTEEDVASPTASGGQPLEQRRPREARISISSPTSSGNRVGAEHIQVSPTSGNSRKVAKTAEIKATKKELKRLKVTKGTESVEVAACLMSLGSLYMNEGDVDSALTVWTQELDVRRSVHGAGHFGVADVLNRIGIIRLEKDEFELAKNCHTQALKIQQACLGENEHNPDVSRTLVNVGNVYYKERNSLSAIKSGVHNAIYDDVIESGMLCRIAFAHDERGEYVRAIHFYDEHVELLKSRGENRHIPGIINALNCLGSLNKKIGRYVEALDYHSKALNMQRAAPQIAKVELANTSVLIGMVEHKAGHFQKALSLFSDALPVQQKFYGKRHSIPGRTIFNQALAYDELADYKKAMSYLEQALSIQKSSLPPEHPDTLSTRMYIARLHSSAGKFDYALTALLGVLNSQKQLFGPKHPLVADTLHNIGISHARKGKMHSALKAYEECFSTRKEILGYDHPDIASCLNSIAAVHASKKRNEKALPIYEAALKIRRDALGDQHVDVARTLSNQGVAYAALRDFGRAMQVYDEAKAIREAALGQYHPSVGDSHVNIGNVFLRKCAFSEARREFESALDIYKKSSLPSDDPKIARTMAVIERVKRDEELCV